MMTETGIGAGWAHSGSLPPWMEQRPGFDEAEAADAADRAALLAERFGTAAALIGEDPTDRPATWTHRRAVLDLGMYPAVGRGRRGLVVPAVNPTEDLPAVAYARLAA